MVSVGKSFSYEGLCNIFYFILEVDSYFLRIFEL